ncbi:hypothetical protein [Curtobacterium sp. DN_7.5]|uniref:hypothetical protein n=1 Tax=Curtobacterium sp. DN_7.5 TaxID=3049047 RepID=UPI001F570133|nr:hypothetical protein [Curtobacterium sp. DN_7.5]
MTEEALPEVAPDVEPALQVYPDSTVGVLLRQRDDLQRAIDADRVTVGIIAARIDEAAARVAQLEQSIDVLGGAPA